MSSVKEMLGPGTVPENVKSALEAIDPNVELLHLEGKRWWLVAREPNPEATKKLAGIMKAKERMRPLDDPAETAMVEHELGIQLVMLRIMAAGHKPIALYEIDGAPGMDVVEDFRLRDHNWRTKSIVELQKELREHTSTDHHNKNRAAEFGKLAKERAADAFAYVFKKARSVLVGANLE